MILDSKNTLLLSVKQSYLSNKIDVFNYLFLSDDCTLIIHLKTLHLIYNKQENDIKYVRL